MSNSILIIDDDKRLRELLEDYLLEKKSETGRSSEMISLRSWIIEMGLIQGIHYRSGIICLCLATAHY